MNLDTANLRLLAYSAADLAALLEGVRQFEERVGIAVADGVRDFFVSGDVSPEWLNRLRKNAGAPPDPWAYGYGVVHRGINAVIGTAGFKGPPDADGVVEIAYGIVPSQEGRGFATEAAHALVKFALANEAVRLVRAHTLPNPNASTRVLSKNGFTFTGEVVDPEDGPVWRWELPRGANALGGIE
jgi:RimJ/RimL family protein N-acetyltransferase